MIISKRGEKEVENNERTEWKKSLDTYSRRELTTRSWRRFELKVILPSFFRTGSNCARHVKYFLIHRNTARLINSRSCIYLEIPEIFLSRVSRKWMQFVRALQNFTLSATLLLPALESAAFNFRIVYPQFFLFFASAPRRGKFLDPRRILSRLFSAENSKGRTKFHPNVLFLE